MMVAGSLFFHEKTMILLVYLIIMEVFLLLLDNIWIQDHHWIQDRTDICLNQKPFPVLYFGPGMV